MTLGAFVAQAASACAVVVALVLRLRGSAPVQRLMLAGVVALMAALAVALTLATVLHAAGDDDAVVRVGWAYAPIFVAIPLVFLIGQLRGRMFAGAALRRVLGTLGPRPSAARLERGLRRSLGDPSLRVAFPVAAGGHHDVEGHLIDVTPQPELAVAVLRDADGEVATIVHDPALDDIPGLMDAAGAAALLALRHARLSAALRASVRDLHSSRARVAAAVDDARRRLERELATGAERQLAGVHDQLVAAEVQATDPHLRSILAGLAREADAGARERAGDGARDLSAPARPGRDRGGARIRARRLGLPRARACGRRAAAVAGRSRRRSTSPASRRSRTRRSTGDPMPS